MKNNEHLSHAGKKGMKWGYNDGVRNGKRTASELVDDKVEEATIERVKDIAESSTTRAGEYFVKNLSTMRIRIERGHKDYHPTLLPTRTRVTRVYTDRRNKRRSFNTLTGLWVRRNYHGN